MAFFRGIFYDGGTPMKPKKRQKLCHHCEAEVDLDVIVCPYCAADLREEKPEQRSPQVQSVRPVGVEQSLYPSYEPKEPEKAQSLPVVEEEEPAAKSSWFNFALCTVGAQLLVVGMLMGLCSEGGELVLRWNAKWWLFYMLAAGPCLFFGLRGLKN